MTYPVFLRTTTRNMKYPHISPGGCVWVSIAILRMEWRSDSKKSFRSSFWIFIRNFADFYEKLWTDRRTTGILYICLCKTCTLCIAYVLVLVVAYNNPILISTLLVGIMQHRWIRNFWHGGTILVSSLWQKEEVCWLGCMCLLVACVVYSCTLLLREICILPKLNLQCLINKIHIFAILIWFIIWH